MSDGKMIVSMRYHAVYRVHCAVSSVITRTVIRGAKQGGGLGGSQPPLNFGWGG